MLLACDERAGDDASDDDCVARRLLLCVNVSGDVVVSSPSDVPFTIRPARRLLVRETYDFDLAVTRHIEMGLQFTMHFGN